MKLENLVKNTVDIWIIDIEKYSIELFWPLLNAIEKDKANRYQVQKAKKNFIVIRGCLKTILSKYLQTSPQEIALVYTPNGKPILKNNSENGLCFNVSHSKNLGVIGITRNDDIGIDVEYMEDMINYNEIIKRFFSEKEHVNFQQLIKTAEKEAFYNSWTKKEAYIKATGDGFRRALSSFSVGFDKGYEIYSDGHLKWHFFSNEISPGYMFSVVKKSPIAKIEYFVL